MDISPIVTAQVSVLSQVRAVQGKHFHLNIIRVGKDNFPDAAFVNEDYALYIARQIYATVNLGIGRVEHYYVLTADADGKDDIGSKKESKQLTQDWTVPNDGIDAFIVQNISAGFGGRSPIDGTCDKDANKGDSGPLAGESGQSAAKAARALPHEIGHYLGLSHTTNPTNLMTPVSVAGVTLTGSLQLTSNQGQIVRGHCFVRDGC
ncbi:MAG: matrixin family metalloprotease [Bryobacteraceae bacterium]